MKMKDKRFNTASVLSLYHTQNDDCINFVLLLLTARFQRDRARKSITIYCSCEGIEESVRLYQCCILVLKVLFHG